MALEKVKTVDIETSGATKSLADLRKQINDAKNALFELTEGTDEYNDKMLELGYAQDEMNSFMALTRQGCSALAGSYNALSYLMGLLKQEYKATADEAKRAELAELISGINDQLKEMDAAVGVFSRNVGNYTGAMNDVFGKLGITVGNLGPLFNTFANSAAEAGAKGQSAFTGLANGAKGLGQSLKTLAANPVGAAIIAIVAAVKAAMFVFDKFKESVNRNEEASNNLKKAMAPIKAVVDVLRNAFDNLVETITKFLGWMGEVISAIGSFLGIAGETIAVENLIAEQEVSNAEMHRKYLVENAQLELEASEARAKANEKDKYSAKERLALMNEYAKKQQEIAANNLKEAQEELRLLELQASTGKNNAEMNNKLAAAQAKVLQVQTAYNNTLRETNGQIAQLNTQIKKEAADTQKAVLDTQKKAADAAKLRAEEIANIRKQYMQKVNSLSDELMADNYQKQRVQAKRALDEEIKEFKEMLKKKAISQKEYNKAVYQANNVYYKLVKEINEKERLDLEEFVKDINRMFKSEALNKIEDENDKWHKKMAALDKAYADGLIKNDEDYWKAKEAINAAGLKAILKVRDEEYVKQEQEELKKNTDLFRAQSELELSILDQQYKQGLISTLDYITLNFDLRIQANDELLAAENEYRSEINRLYEEGKISKEAYDAAILESDQVVTDLLIANLDLIKEKQDTITDGYITTLGALMDTMSEFASSISSIGDGISSKWGNVFSNMSSMVDSVGTALKSNEKGFKKWGLVAAQACSAVSSMFGALADEQDENSEEGFEAAKKLRYAEALFSMASGIMSVWPAAMQLGPIAGPIMGSILTAMIAGMGAAQMANIAKTKYGDTSSASASASSSGVSASIQAPVQYTSDVTPASQENTNTDTRVYVLESDISSTQKKVNVALGEAYF